ncbi:UNVERIFIED_ORG: hypothetical protein J2X80_001864 [Pseudomonas fluorescens]|nr:hypothetical protein [Pseudomonas fluorescens]
MVTHFCNPLFLPFIKSNYLMPKGFKNLSDMTVNSSSGLEYIGVALMNRNSEGQAPAI